MTSTKRNLINHINSQRVKLNPVPKRVLPEAIAAGYKYVLCDFNDAMFIIQPCAGAERIIDCTNSELNDLFAICHNRYYFGRTITDARVSADPEFLD